MINEFRKYRKFHEYFSWQFENKFALAGSIVITVVMLLCNFHKMLYVESSLCVDFIMTAISTNIASIALVFTGIAFWGELFDKRLREEIKVAIGDEAITQLYVSYLFLAVNLLGNTVINICLIILIRSNLEVPSPFFLYLSGAVYIYWFLFIWGYFVSLIWNCVRLIRSKNKLEENERPTFYDKANELRIDYLIDCMFKNIDSDKLEELLLGDLEEYTKAVNDEKLREQLKNYFNDYYSRKDKKIEV